MAGIRLASGRVSQQRAGRTGLRRFRSSRWVIAAYLFLSAASFRVLFAQENPTGGNPIPKPAWRIDLSTVGYQELPRMARLGDEAILSLDFVDADHVLLTFNQRKLFKRLPDCPPDHDDRQVRAVVLEVSSGKVVKEADWYLHDRLRYLWSLGSGRFLLRKLNRLYIVDSSLQEKLLMSSPKDLLWVAVTPDKKQIIVETAENADTSSTKHSESGTQPARKNVKPEFLIAFLDVDTLEPQRTIKSSTIVNLEGTSTGYADSVHKGDLWLIRYGPTPTERHNIARVRSQTVPRVFYSSNNSLLIGRCPTAGCDYSVTAFTVTGRRLWRQRWSQLRYSPTVSHSGDNSRFGVSTVRHTALSSAPVDTDEEESNNRGAANDGIEENVEVFETASGNPILSLDVIPAVRNGQNFSLSPDGLRLAVLHHSDLELYELPQTSDEEKAKFTALKAGVPGLYMLSSKSETESQLESDATADSGQEETTQIAGNGLAEPMAAAQYPPNAPPVAAAPVRSAEEKGEPMATLKVNARAVVVDVVVTDAKSHPAKGLRQGDFRVMEDGKPQDVRYFREVSDAENTPASDLPTKPAPAKLAPNIFTNNSHAPDSGAVTMILLDLLNTPSQDQQYARQELIKFLKSKTTKSQMALCTLSSGRAAYLRLIQGFTPDEDTLAAAINNGKQSEPRMARWQAAASGTDNAVNTVREFAKNDWKWQALLHGLEQMQAEGQVTDTDLRVEITVDALTQLARYLSGIPGRKNLVWLSGSFPLSISPSGALNDPAIDNRNYGSKIKQATNLLAEGQIAVYPVDVRGVPAGGVNAADNIGIAPDRTASRLAPGQRTNNGDTIISPAEAFQHRMMQELGSRSSARETMNQFAADTGGVAFFSANAIESAIATATEQGTNYYTLSYSPSNKNYNGRFRRIKVALAQKEYRLHYRQGYFAESAAGPVNGDGSANAGAAAMQHGSPQSHQIHFAVRVVPVGAKVKVDNAKASQVPQASKKKPGLPATIEVQHYGIDYAIDSSDLRFIPLQNEVHHTALAFMAAAFGDDGRRLSGASNVWTSDLNPNDFKDVISGGVRIHQEFDVPAEAVSLRLGLQDKMNNHLGTVELPLPVAAPPEVPRTVKHSLPEIEPD